MSYEFQRFEEPETDYFELEAWNPGYLPWRINI